MEVEPFCGIDSSIKEEGVVVAAAGELLADLGNGDLATIRGRVGVVVSKEGNEHNGKRSRQGRGMRLYECGGWR